MWDGMVEGQRREGEMVREEQEERCVSRVYSVVDWSLSDSRV